MRQWLRLTPAAAVQSAQADFAQFQRRIHSLQRGWRARPGPAAPPPGS